MRKRSFGRAAVTPVAAFASLFAFAAVLACRGNADSDPPLDPLDGGESGGGGDATVDAAEKDGSPGPTSGDASPPATDSGFPKGNDTPVEAGTFLVDFVGNSFGSAVEGGVLALYPTIETHVQEYFASIFVAPDGTVYTNSRWDEGGNDGAVYRNGQVVGRFKFGAGGYGRDGDGPVTVNKTYAFVAMRQKGGEGNMGNKNGLPNDPDAGTTWHCVERYNLATATSEPTMAMFDSGVGYDSAMLYINSTDSVTGLAASDDALYVTDPSTGLIRVFDPNTMAPKSSFSVPHAGQIALDTSGTTLWIAVDGTIVRYTTSGQALDQKITFPASMQPTGFALDGAGHLAVGDSGPDNDIKIYDLTNAGALASSPSLYTEFGQRGGVLDAGGALGDQRFYHPQAVGYDGTGNLYVASDLTDLGTTSANEPDAMVAVAGGHGAGGVLESYGPSGARNPAWPARLNGLLWLDVGDLDPATEVDMYFADKHFVYQYGDPVGQGWFWKGYTVDKYRYPSDPRLYDTTSSGSVTVRHVLGQTLLYVNDQYGHAVRFYRLDPTSEIAIPCGAYFKELLPGNWSADQPANESLWLDKDGDGAPSKNEFFVPDASVMPPDGGALSVDDLGNLYTATADGRVRTLPIGKALDAHGAPVYDFSQMTIKASPSTGDHAVKELCQVEYQAATDTMVLGAFTTGHPSEGTQADIAGTEALVIAHWSTSAPAYVTSALLPYSITDADSTTHYVKSMAFAGNYIFAADYNIPDVYVFSATDGTTAATLSPPASFGHVGNNDMIEGLHARLRSNGEYMVIVEDDGSIRQLVYRWSP
jgi:hypothetical protein